MVMKTFFRKLGYICIVSLFLASCEDDLLEEESFIKNKPEAYITKAEEVNPFWDWVNFPGPVSDKIPRLGKDTVNYFVRGEYEEDIFYNRHRGDTFPTPSPWFGPGLYAGIMEPINVEVPEGVTNLRCLVGSHPHFLGFGYNQRNPKPRWADIQDTIYLKPGKNTFSSYFGGMIYFYWQDQTEPVKPGVNVIISGGCVRSNNYVAGKTDYDAWIKSVRSRYVRDTIGVDDAGNLIIHDVVSDSVLKWVDMVGEYAIVTCPYTDFEDCENPAACLQAIDNWLRGYYELFGFPVIQKDGKLLPQRRIVSDVSGCSNGPGNMQSFIAIPVQQFYRNQYLSKGLWDYDFMTLSANRHRLITEMLMYPDRTRAQGIGEVFPTEFLKYFLAARFYNKLPAGAYDLPYLCSDENEFRHLPRRFQDQPTKVACLIALVNEFNWGLIPYTMHAARATGYGKRKGSGQPHERFAMHCCEYTNMNLEGFFENWGWELSSYAVSYMKKFPEPETEFWLNYRDRIADYDPVIPPVNSTLQTKEPTPRWMNNRAKRKWGVKSGISATQARKAIDGNNSERNSLMANNVEQKDAWVEIDFKDTLYINIFNFQFPNSFVGMARSIKLKLGNYIDDAKTKIDWQYVKNSKGEDMEFRLRCWRGQPNVLNLPKMYRAELARVEIITMGYHRDFISINPWPTTCAVGELQFGRSEYPNANPDWPYPYIPPVKD